MGTSGPKFYGAAAVRELERRAAAAGVPGAELMRRAGAAALRELLRRWPRAARIAVLCGPGNNGGDGYVLAAEARAAGLAVAVFQVGPPAGHGDAVAAREAWLRSGGTAPSWRGPAIEPCDVVVDALLGLGLSRPPEGLVATAIAAIEAARQSGAGVLALDLPSGLDADRGAAPGAAVRADLTVTFLAPKPGLQTGAGPHLAGDCVLDRLGIPAGLDDGLPPLAQALDAAALRGLLPQRRRDAHKGHLGHVLVVGGERGTVGAALLAGRAALRAGAGLVSVATRPEHCMALTAAQPELMCHGVDEPRALRTLLQRASVIAAGPGLGQGDWGRGLLAEILTARAPLVLDADALNLLAAEPVQREDWILTPHPGEAARLLGCATADVQADRLGAARGLARRYGGTVVLKGAGTLVAGAELGLCPLGNPGMASGGTGDALCGVIASLRAQGLAAEAAARAGVVAHALAGDRAARAGQRGLLASDLIAELRGVLAP